MPIQETLFCPECYRSFEAGHGYCPEHGARLVLLPREETGIGTVIAERYRVEAELGVGGAGVVYRAAHTVIDRPIALKIFRRFLADDPAAAGRFDAEADGALQLKGRHTVQVYDSGRTEDGRLFLAREFVDGPTLAELLSTDRRVAPARALRVALGVTRALEYAHARGVLHRGISPGNIFLVQDGGEELVRVADFGQAAMFTGEDGVSLRPEGLAIRPLRYLSPEQAVGAACDVSADLYGLGVILFEILTGRPPFPGDSPVELLLAHAREAPPPFSEVAPDITLPPRVEALVRSLLAKQPKQRPASASVLASELEVLLKDPTVGGASGPTHRGVDAPPTGEVKESGPEPDDIVVTPAPPTFPDHKHGLTDPVGSAAVLLPTRSRLPWFIGGAAALLVLAVVGLFASGVISQKGEDPSEAQETTENSAPVEPAEPPAEPPMTADIIAAPEVAVVLPEDIVPELTLPDLRPELAEPEDLLPQEDAPPPEDLTPEPSPTPPDLQPEIVPDIAPEVIPDVAPDIAPDIAPDVAPDIGPEVIPDVAPEVVEEKTPPVEGKKPPVEVKKPPVEVKKPDPVIAKPAGMGEEDYVLAKEQVSWGRKNMKKQLWEMGILNFQQAKRMGLTDPAIGRYIKECRNHMAIVADALEHGHAAYLAGQWDEAIRQFQRARDHGEKNTTTFRMIETAKEAKAKEAADKAN